MCKVLLLSENKLIAQAIIAMVNGVEGIVLVLKKSEEIIQYQKTLKESDVVLVLFFEENENGMENLQQAFQIAKGKKILLITNKKEIGFIRKAIRQGIKGCFLLEENKEELILAIKKVCSGENYFSSGIAQRVLGS